MTRTRGMLYAALSALLVASVAHCSGESDTTLTGAPTAAAGGAGTGTAAGGSNTGGGTAGWGQGGLHEVACQGHVYECGDMIDNDGDDLTDWEDPDCLGPCDNTEDSFYGGIPGQAGPACQVDCYFDQDSGSGNDQCYWDHICDPLSVSPEYYPEPWNGDACEYAGPDELINPIHVTCDTLLNADGQLQACLDFCLPLTPNGCDCFGCCELPAGSGDFVWLGSEGVDSDNPTECALAEIANPDICHPCTPVTDCFNGCGRCEICIGKTPADLPADCFPDGGTGGSGGGGMSTQCEPGVQACGLPGQEPCSVDQYCITGCCRDIPT